jgi:hypothetical protein
MVQFVCVIQVKTVLPLVIILCGKELTLGIIAKMEGETITDPFLIARQQMNVMGILVKGQLNSFIGVFVFVAVGMGLFLVDKLAGVLISFRFTSILVTGRVLVDENIVLVSMNVNAVVDIETVLFHNIAMGFGLGCTVHVLRMGNMKDRGVAVGGKTDFVGLVVVRYMFKGDHLQGVVFVKVKGWSQG